MRQAFNLVRCGLTTDNTFLLLLGFLNRFLSFFLDLFLEALLLSFRETDIHQLFANTSSFYTFWDYNNKSLINSPPFRPYNATAKIAARRRRRPRPDTKRQRSTRRTRITARRKQVQDPLL